MTHRRQWESSNCLSRTKRVKWHKMEFYYRDFHSNSRSKSFVQIQKDSYEQTEDRKHLEITDLRRSKKPPSSSKMPFRDTPNKHKGSKQAINQTEIWTQVLILALLLSPLPVTATRSGKMGWETGKEWNPFHPPGSCAFPWALCLGWSLRGSCGSPWPLSCQLGAVSSTQKWGEGTIAH